MMITGYPDILEEMIAQATRIRDNIERRKLDAKEETFLKLLKKDPDAMNWQTTAVGFKGKCRNCGKFGYMARNCRKFKKSKTGKNGKCYECGKSGYFAKDCRQR